MTETPPSATAPPPRSVLKEVLKFVPVAIVFIVIAMAGLYRAPKRSNFPPEVREELQRLEDQAPNVNFVFIGSSYTGYHLQVKPLIQAAAEEGVDLHPVVVALPAMEMFEADAMIDEILKLELPQLRWIGLEYRPWDPGALEDFYNTKRLTWWQSPERTGRVIKVAWAEAVDDEDRDDAFPLIARLGFRLLMNYTRVGQRAEPVDTEAEDRQTADYMAYRDGPMRAKVDEAIAKKVEKHRERRKRNDGWDDPGDERYVAVTTEAYAEQVRQVREAGVELIYIVHASLIKKGVKPDAPVLDLDDPEAHPAFFKAENRVDETHMRESQFVPYSELVGRELAKLIRSDSGGGAGAEAAAPESPEDE